MRSTFGMMDLGQGSRTSPARPRRFRAERRGLLAGIAAGVAAVAMRPGTSWAQAPAFPSKPVRIIVPFAPGGANDFAVRLVADRLQARLRQSVVVENRGGASGNIGAQAAMRAEPDGHTLALLNNNHAVNQSFFRDPGYNLVRDFTPLVHIGTMPSIVMVRRSLPVTSIRELLAYGRSNARGLTFAATGAIHPVILFEALTGMTLVVVNYRGAAPAMTDLIAERVDVVQTTVSDAMTAIQSGDVRALAVATPYRIGSLPHLPTVAEDVPGYSSENWIGLFAPAATPAPNTETLRRELAAIVRTESVRHQLSQRGFEPGLESIEAFAQQISADVERWRSLARETGFTPV